MAKKKNTHPDDHQRSSKPKQTWLYVNIIVAVVLIGSGVGVLFWLGQQSPGNTVNVPNQSTQGQARAAPDFTLPAASGEWVSLSDYRGQVVLVNFWATWCPPCKAEMPTINTFYQTHRHEGFVVLAVNAQEDAQTVNAFMEAHGFSFPVLLDQQAEVMNRYHVRGLPTTFIIDREGIIRHIQSGEITRQQLEAVVMPLL